MRSIRGRRELGGRAALLALAMAGVGCGIEVPAPLPSAASLAPRRGGTITVASFGDIRSLDPANVADGLAPHVLEAIFAGLVDYDADGIIQPDLAERWDVADGGKTYRFTLRQGVRFHDGEELTADDVKRSVERALHPSAPNPSASYYASLAGWDDFSAKRRDTLTGVEVEGRYLVSFHLTEPDATFLPLMAMVSLRPVCRSAGDRYDDTWHACGAGPFKLPPGGWDRAREVRLERHPGYFRPGLPYLDGVRFQFHVNQTSQKFKFARGEQDVLRDFLAPDLLKFQADPRWTPFGDFEAEHAVSGESMNTEMPPFDNVEIRRAVASAIDREQLRLVRAANLRVADQLVPPAVFGHDDTLRGQHHDLAEALEHMRRAGYPYDPETRTGGWPHVIPYLVYKQSLVEFTSQVLKEQLARIGLRIEIHVVNYPTFLAIRNRRGQSPMAPGSWTQDYPEALSFLEPLFTTRSINDEDSNNASFYKNPRFDELIDRAKRELDGAARKKLYSEAQTILCDDAPWAFTYYYRSYTQRQPYVRDFRSHPMWGQDLKGVWLDRAPSAGAPSSLLDRVFFGDAASPRALARLLGTSEHAQGGDRR